MPTVLPIRTALLLGGALTGLLAVALVAIGSNDPIGLVALLLRYAHVLLGMVWVGLIVFLNIIHIPAIEGASEPERAAFLRWYVPGLATMIRHASTWTVLSGLLLAVATGYLFGTMLYGAAVFVPGAKAALLAFGALGGIVMMGLVHGVIRPGLRAILESTTAIADRKVARERVKVAARLNLMLTLPVVLAMIASAHL